MHALLKGIGGLLALALLVALAWWLSNRWDLAPQPLPAALALPTEVPAERDLLQVLAAVPQPGRGLNPPNCEQGDCAKAWQQALPGLRERLPQWAGFGQACEAASAQASLSAVEVLPARWTLDVALPGYSPFSACVNWWAVRAMLASDDGDAEAALAALRQANRLSWALQQGSRLLVGQMLAQGQLGRQLQLILILRQRHPALRERLIALAEVDGAALMAGTRRWIPAEAAFGRGAVDSLRPVDEMNPALQPPGLPFWRLVDTGMQPEYTKQMMSAQWLRALEAAQGDDPQASWQRQQQIWQPDLGLLGSGLSWFHTIPHWLFDTAKPAMATYFRGAADLQLAAQATHLWLRGGRPEQAPQALRERLSLESNGDWRLRLWNTESTGGLPTRWPAPT